MEKLVLHAEQYKHFEASGLDMTPFTMVGKVPEEAPDHQEVTIKYEKPPNFDQIAARFGRPVHAKGVIFTYGSSIYNPSRVVLTRSLLAHETVHSRRQGADPASWWAKYLATKKFRFDEELIAHQVEYLIASEGVGRAQRRVHLRAIAERLAGKLYGNMTNVETAKQLITGRMAIEASTNIGISQEVANVAAL